MVRQLALHTIGGVVTPAQQLMVVVPAESHREIEAMVQNRDIGFVHEGDAAEIKIDTFSFTKYSPLHGKVLSISADAIEHGQGAEPTAAAPPATRTRAATRPRRAPASRPARSCSTRRASRSTPRACRSRAAWSSLRPAWR
ncbi:MAG TPA: HlyD family efflux transporter periplasmic adaptor subunit [Xanthobacteraceae bacterium]